MVNWNEPNSCYQIWFVFMMRLFISFLRLFFSLSPPKVFQHILFGNAIITAHHANSAMLLLLFFRECDNWCCCCYSCCCWYCCCFLSFLLESRTHMHAHGLCSPTISPLNARQYNVFANTKINECSSFRFFTKRHLLRLLLRFLDISLRLCFRSVFSFVHTFSSLLSFIVIHLQHLSAVCTPVVYVCVCNVLFLRRERLYFRES